MFDEKRFSRKKKGKKILDVEFVNVTYSRKGWPVIPHKTLPKKRKNFKNHFLTVKKTKTTTRSDEDHGSGGRTITTEDYTAFHFLKTKTTMSSGEDNGSGFRTITTTEDYMAFHSMVCSPQTARRCIESFTGATLFGSMEEYGEGDDGGDYGSIDGSSCTNNSDDRDSNNATANTTYLRRLDYRYTAPFLSVPSYYLLVVFSLTGFCTLLGHTQCVQASHPKKKITVDVQDGNGNKSSLRSSTATKVLSQTATSMMKMKNLTIKPQIFQYLLDDNDNCSNTTTTTAAATTNKNKNNNHNNKSGKVEITIDRIFEFSFGSALDVVMMHIFVCGKKEKHLVEVYRINTDTWLGKIGTLTMYPLRSIQRMILNSTIIQSLVGTKSEKKDD